MNSSGRRWLIDRSAVAAATLCLFGLSGCAGATRLPMRERGPAGEHLEKKLDLAFLDESGTRSDEVRERLSAIDTGYANPRLFWGRWSASKWGYWWFVAAQTGGAGDAKRVWHAHNVLVQFDESGIIKGKMLIDDEELWRELHSQLMEAPPLDLTQPMAIAVRGCCGVTDMVLTQDSIRITTRRITIRRNKTSTVELSPQAIVRISHKGVPDKGSSVGTTCHTLHLAEKSEAGKSVHFCADPPSVAAIFQYLNQNGSKNLRWE